MADYELKLNRSNSQIIRILYMYIDTIPVCIKKIGIEETPN